MRLLRAKEGGPRRRGDRGGGRLELPLLFLQQSELLLELTLLELQLLEGILVGCRRVFCTVEGDVGDGAGKVGVGLGKCRRQKRDGMELGTVSDQPNKKWNPRFPCLQSSHRAPTFPAALDS